DSPQREPARELFLDRELLAELGLEDQLALAVALLSPAGRGKGVERPALVVVDPVDPALVGVVECEHRAQHAIAVAAGLECATDRVDADDQIVEVAAAEDQPAE